HKIWLATNHRPRITGTDEAIWRRIRLIPFSVQFHEPGEGKPEKDKKLAETLKAELPGILAWAVQGCLKWQEQGLGTAPEIKQATDSYRAEEDIFGMFLDDCTISKPDAQTKTKDLYTRHVKWCEDNGERLVAKSVWGQPSRAGI
ncbi:MAG: phage/plasmid primase, P4 family, partial [Gammaproteobacteria bacterium]